MLKTEAGIVPFSRKNRSHDVDLPDHQPSLCRRDEELSAPVVTLDIVETCFDIFDSPRSGPLAFCWNFNHLQTVSPASRFGLTGAVV